MFNSLFMNRDVKNLCLGLTLVAGTLLPPAFNSVAVRDDHQAEIVLREMGYHGVTFRGLDVANGMSCGSFLEFGKGSVFDAINSEGQRVVGVYCPNERNLQDLDIIS